MVEFKFTFRGDGILFASGPAPPTQWCPRRSLISPALSAKTRINKRGRSRASGAKLAAAASFRSFAAGLKVRVGEIRTDPDADSPIRKFMKEEPGRSALPHAERVMKNVHALLRVLGKKPPSIAALRNLLSKEPPNFVI